MAERQFAPDLLAAIRRKQYVRSEQGLDILIKPIPDDDRPGAMDPRLLAITAPIVQGIRGILITLAAPLFLKTSSPRRAAAFMRRYFNGIQSIPVTEGVSVRRETLVTPGAAVPIRIYRRETGGQSAAAPVFVYFHGGGFAAGNPGVVEEMVKQVVYLSGCVAIQPDYRLAPEHPFPAALDDCWETLKWAYANAASFGGDRRRVFVAGDSAGGNLAAVCAMRDRDQQSAAAPQEGAAPSWGAMVQGQALLYPVLNVAGTEDEQCRFAADRFTILAAHRKAALFRINSMRPGSEGLLGRLLGVSKADARRPELSPYRGDPAGLPPCLIICGEFDCLRLAGEAYARKLKAAGVPVRVIRYLGMGHAFAEWIGVQPQAEDCMREISRFITGHDPGIAEANPGLTV